MSDRRKRPGRPQDERQGSGRERISRAAYDLFSREGVRAVGVDAVIAQAGTAKMTLYRNFPDYRLPAPPRAALDPGLA